MHREHRGSSALNRGAAVALQRQGVITLLGLSPPASRVPLFALQAVSAYDRCRIGTPTTHRLYDTVYLHESPHHGLVETNGKQGPDEPAGCGCAESSARSIDQTPVLAHERAVRSLDIDRRRGTSPRLIVPFLRRLHGGLDISVGRCPSPSTDCLSTSISEGNSSPVGPIGGR